MLIFKLVLFGLLRVMLLGSLKMTLLVYALFLSDKPFSGAAH
jgi:hypothetical protein